MSKGMLTASTNTLPGVSDPSSSGQFWQNVRSDTSLGYRSEEMQNNAAEKDVPGFMSYGRTVMLFKSVSVSSSRLGSPAYMATVRRRIARTIAKQVADLAGYITREVFSTYTLPIVDALRKGLNELIEADAEGNSREVFRLVRDTFLNRGWESYRQQSVRNVVQLLLTEMASADKLESAFAHKAYDRLAGVGLKMIPLTLAEPDDEVSD